MKRPWLHPAQFPACIARKRAAEFVRDSFFFVPCKRQVGSERTLLARHPNSSERIFDRNCQRGESLLRLHSNPQNARSPLIWKESQPAKFHWNRPRARNSSQSFANAVQLFQRCLDKKFQRDVQIFRARPFPRIV